MIVGNFAISACFSAWRKVSQLWPVKPRSVQASHRIRMLMPL
jgi:hypothetical protein